MYTIFKHKRPTHYSENTHEHLKLKFKFQLSNVNTL